MTTTDPKGARSGAGQPAGKPAGQTGGQPKVIAASGGWWPLIKVLPVRTHFRFVRLARLAAAVSVLLVLATAVGLFKPGLNMGIDFRGGTVLEMSTAPQATDLGRVREAVSRLNLGDVQVQAFGSNTDTLLRFQTPAGQDAAVVATRVQDALRAEFGAVRFSNTQVVGPKVSGELFRNGILALAAAIGLMLLYIWFRFELQFGVGAVIALLHDVILTFGLIVLFRLEFSLNMIAAILTIIGYSMNDTVVVFDRLRENLQKYRRMPLRELIDLSINETLSRTVITGITAILALGGLAIFGGEALFGFSIALIFGIAIGTYSSIYVAAPVILLWGVKRGDALATEGGRPVKAVVERP